MLEQFSQSEIKIWINKIIRGLKDGRLPMPENWRTNDIGEPNIITTNGLIIIRWRDPLITDRLKATFSYKDGSGDPFVSLVFDENNVLQEVEIWRGDGSPLAFVPTIDDLEVPEELN